MMKNNGLFAQEDAILIENQNIASNPDNGNNLLIKPFSALLKYYKSTLRQNKKLVKIGDNQQAELNRINEILNTKNHALKTAYKKIQEQESKIINQEKLAILGDITASVAHEISTPLMALTMGLEKIIR